MTIVFKFKFRRTERQNVEDVGGATSDGMCVPAPSLTSEPPTMDSGVLLAPPDAEAIAEDPTSPLDRVIPGELAEDPSCASFDPASMMLPDVARLAMLDAMPVAVFLIDQTATVRFANQRTAEMMGMRREDTFGRNVLDFVLVEDLDFAADLLNGGSRYSGKTMGPSRVRYLDASGNQHWTQVWASEAPPELGVDGFIVTLTNESVRDVLATAVSSVAVDNELDRTLAAVALAARAMPLEGRGAILIAQPAAGDDDTRFRAVGTWPLDESAVNAFGTPWRKALVNGEDCDVDDVAKVGLAPVARDALLAAGVAALFVRTIRNVADAVIGILIVFRGETGAASVNQDDHLGDAVRLASLAFAQVQSRRELQAAAHRDALTGIANRAAFNERVVTERRTCDVLFVDLDHFKTVNDTFGHQIGDLVVTGAAKRIAAAVRRGDTVYRTGGDEFVVVCDAMGDDPAQRVAMSERIIERLMAPFDVANHRVRIAATIGIAEGSGRSLEATVRAADAALYAAKERGRAGWSHAPRVA
jgi:diguanylate cyclase (GGDEF)-like protein/PAS domain S-box-containing protein